MLIIETVNHFFKVLEKIEEKDKSLFLLNFWERSKKDESMLKLAIYAVFLSNYHSQYLQYDWISSFDAHIHPKVNALYKDEIHDLLKQKYPLQSKLFQILTNHHLSKQQKQMELIKHAIDEDLTIAKWLDYRILEIRDKSQDDLIRELITTDEIICHVETKNKSKWMINEFLESKSKIGYYLGKFLSKVTGDRLFKPVWVTMIRFVNHMEESLPDIYQLFNPKLKQDINEIQKQISFADFRNFIDVLIEQYKNTKKSNKKIDDGDRIQRRVFFWENYKDKFKNTIFLLPPEDYDVCEPYLKLGLINELNNVMKMDQIPCPILYCEIENLSIFAHLTMSSLKTYLISNQREQIELRNLMIQQNINAILQILDRQEMGFKLDYFWQVLFSMLLAKNNIDIDHPKNGFRLNTKHIEKYTMGKGIDFEPSKMKVKDCELMRYLNGTIKSLKA
jgi:hypothetical protein